MIYNYFQYYSYKNDLKGQSSPDWRATAMYWITVIPPAFLVFDSIFNKIRLPARHFGYLLVIIIASIVATYIGQTLQEGIPIYYTNTNWYSDLNPAFLYNYTSSDAGKSEEDYPQIIKAFPSP